jgi:hypothetical protein
MLIELLILSIVIVFLVDLHHVDHYVNPYPSAARSPWIDCLDFS